METLSLYLTLHLCYSGYKVTRNLQPYKNTLGCITCLNIRSIVPMCNILITQGLISNTCHICHPIHFQNLKELKKSLYVCPL